MQRTPTVARATLAILAALTIAACGGGGGSNAPRSAPAASPSPKASPAPASSADASPAPAASSNAVSIKGFAFTPDALTVPVGTTLTWRNDEDSLHTVTSGTPEAPTGLFDSGEIDTGIEFPFTFAEQGSFPFFCARHDFMKGVVTVTP